MVGRQCSLAYPLIDCVWSDLFIELTEWVKVTVLLIQQQSWTRSHRFQDLSTIISTIRMIDDS